MWRHMTGKLLQISAPPSRRHVLTRDAAANNLRVSALSHTRRPAGLLRCPTRKLAGMHRIA